MTTKVITIEDFEGIPEGSVFDARATTNEDGKPVWAGMWSSMLGTYEIAVPVAYCEAWTEEKHDPMAAYFRRQFHGEIAADKPGELPRQFLLSTIARQKRVLEDLERSYIVQDISVQRQKYWLKCLETYFDTHYKDHT